MELNEASILNIFRENFSFPIVNTVIGKAVKMEALDAFHFANITGAGYLDDPTYPFSPKGVMKILRQAFQYNIVTGVYDGSSLYYSPTELMNIKPYLFSGYKYIVITECKTEAQFRVVLDEAYKRLLEKEIQTTDFVFFRVEAWKKGNGMENFLEYLTCEYFRNHGYIVENQIPLVHVVGTPDFGGYHLKNGQKGFHIIELSMLKKTGNVGILDDLAIDHAIVGEAKTSTTIMAKQLEKYLNTSAFLKGYEIHPDKSDPTHDCFGLINIGEDFIVKCREPLNSYNKIGSTVFDFNEYMEWFQNSLKFYIVANLNNDELKTFIEANKPNGKYSQSKIIDVILNTSISEIVKTVKEKL